MDSGNYDAKTPGKFPRWCESAVGERQRMFIDLPDRTNVAAILAQRNAPHVGCARALPSLLRGVRPAATGREFADPDTGCTAGPGVWVPARHADKKGRARARPKEKR